METETQMNTDGVNMARRSFLRYAGTGLAAAGVITAASCSKKVAAAPSDLIDIGSGDTGLLNFIYALEQVQAALFTQVIATPYLGIVTSETAFLTDIRDHDIIHREFSKTLLGSSAIQTLTPDWTLINFSSRFTVLTAATQILDTIVEAYNTSAYLFSNSDYVTILGKIVSVKARHSAYIRNLNNLGSANDTTILDANGMDKGQPNSPTLQVMTIAPALQIMNLYLKTHVSAKNYSYVTT
jgi:hypothetical protein